MRKLANIVVMVCLITGFISCKEDNIPASDLTLDETTLELKKDESTVLTIEEGNGGYKVDMSDPKIARAVLSGNTVTILVYG